MPALTSRRILSFLAVINNFSWDAMYEDIVNKRRFDLKDPKVVEAMDEAERICEEGIMMFEKDYPQELKALDCPPFVVWKVKLLDGSIAYFERPRRLAAEEA